MPGGGEAVLAGKGANSGTDSRTCPGVSLAWLYRKAIVTRRKKYGYIRRSEIVSRGMMNPNTSVDRASDEEYQGWLGIVIRKGPYFFASKDGTLVGAYKRFDEAMKALVLGEAEYPN
jgi:hypothetical protein